jgi:hypothetical protein
MGLMVELPPELEDQLHKSAAREGKPLEQYAVDALKRHLSLTYPPSLEKATEAELLEAICCGFPSSFWERYNGLKELQAEGTISERERAEIIRMSNQVEEEDARRLRYLVALAARRGRTLREVMTDLGLAR